MCQCSKCKSTKPKGCLSGAARGYMICSECRKNCKNDTSYVGSIRPHHVGKHL